MNKLFDDNDDQEIDFSLTTNKEYARNYLKTRQSDLLRKFKDRNIHESDSDTSEDDTDDDEPVNPEFNQNFFKTLASLKNNDPKIFDKNVRFFDSKTDEDETKKIKKSKPLYINQYETKVLLETEGKMEDSEDEAPHFRSESPTIIQEQNMIKNEFKKALNDNDSDSDNHNVGGLFKKRDKPREEEIKEEEIYTKWLSGQQTDIGEDAKPLAPLKEYWSNPKISKEDAFLRDYVLNNGYVDDDVDVSEMNLKGLSDDEKEIDRQDDFERTYNFRYEEPDQQYLKRYPRQVEASVRKVDQKRSKKRLEVKERKEIEKEQKLRELQVLKEIKKAEIEEKIAKLKEVTGNDTLAFETADFNNEFDPEEHDKKMKELFDDQYYQENEDEEKPECPDFDELKFEDWDNYNPNNSNYDRDTNENNDYNEEFEEDYTPHCEDDSFIMDCDYTAVDKKKALQDELIETTSKRRKKRRSKFAEFISKEKPAFNPEDEKKYAEYIDEYYKLDYEDMIGDIPCRFKYVETVPNDFGLTVEEIFMAKNSELNCWASLKKAVQIRSKHVEKNEIIQYQNKAQNFVLKKKIFPSIYGPQSDEENEDEVKEEIKKEPLVAVAMSSADRKKLKNRKKNEKRKQKIKILNNIIKTQNNVGVKVEDMKKNNGSSNSHDLSSTETDVILNVDKNKEENVEVKKKKKKKHLTSESDNNKETTNIKLELNENVTPTENLIETKKKKKREKSQEIKEKTLENNIVQSTDNLITPPPEIKKIKKKKRKLSDSDTEVKEKIKKIKLEKNNIVQVSNKNNKINNLNNQNKKQKNRNKRKSDVETLSDKRLLAFGITPKKFRYMERKFKNIEKENNKLKKKTSKSKKNKNKNKKTKTNNKSTIKNKISTE